MTLGEAALLRLGQPLGRGTAVSHQQPHSWELRGQQYPHPERGSRKLTPASSLPWTVCVLGGCSTAGIRKEPKMGSVP